MRNTKEFAMKILTTSIVLGPLMLIGMLSAAAGQPIVAPGSGAPIPLATARDSSPDRDAYIQKAQGDMLAWQQKLHAFSKKAEADGKKADNEAENDLNKAWHKADAASGNLQTAGTEDWESARTSYENASKDLANAWDKFRRNNT
jgi:hypothetical protein